MKSMMPSPSEHFIREMMDSGILTLGSHLLSYAHSEEDIAILIAAYGTFLEKLAIGLQGNRLLEMLRCKPLKPLFKVRKDT